MSSITPAHAAKGFIQQTGQIAGLISAFASLPFWYALPRPMRLARGVEVRFFRRLLRSIGVEVSLDGSFPPQKGTLFICNHISWADIPVLAQVLDAAFVARADAGNWPVIGRIMQRYGVILVDRTRPGTSAQQVEAIRARLRAGQSVIVFPEGTTSLGVDILPFRSSLLQAADAAQAVQPVVLRYLTPLGEALPADVQRNVAWIGDDTLLDGIRSIMRAPMRAHLQFLPPTLTRDRKLLARELRDQMSRCYAALPNRSR
jgi:1-acyl-sn-glycerol-3-phosphate acyltransferase